MILSAGTTLRQPACPTKVLIDRSRRQHCVLPQCAQAQEAEALQSIFFQRQQSYGQWLQKSALAHSSHGQKMTGPGAVGSSLGSELGAVPTQCRLKRFPKLLLHSPAYFPTNGYGLGALSSQVAQIHVGRSPAVRLHVWAGALQKLQHRFKLGTVSRHISFQQARLGATYLRCPGCQSNNDAISGCFSGDRQDTIVRTKEDKRAVLQTRIFPSCQSSHKIRNGAI
jgi:hypothetical protein